MEDKRTATRNAACLITTAHTQTCYLHLAVAFMHGLMVVFNFMALGEQQHANIKIACIVVYSSLNVLRLYVALL